MKKMMGLMLMVLSFHGAFATSMLGTTLQYDRTNKVLSANPNHQLSVFTDGTVVHRTISAQLPGGSSVQVVAHLTVLQMDRIFRLVRRSTPVVRVFVRSAAMCFAPSSFTDKYTAANGSIFLKEGAVCDGGFEINRRPAAQRLVRILSVLETAAHQRANFAAVESSIEEALN